MLSQLFFPTLAYGATLLAHSYNPLPEYQFSWTANQAASNLNVEVKVTPPEGQTVGWVGFGIAGGGGGMLGSDVFTAYSAGNSTCVIQDRRSSDSTKTLPKEDTQNADGFADWKLNSCSNTGGVLVVAASRAFVTNDVNDLDFVSGPMKLLFAWGQDTPSSPSSSLGFHNGGYVPKEVSLWGAAVEHFNKTNLESDYDVLSLTVPGLSIGTGDTYFCTGFNLTEKDGKPTQAIVFEPIVEVINKPYVHHMVLYTCRTPMSSTPFECSDMPPGCSTILWAWGKGANTFVLPQVTGIEMGTAGRTYAALQMHYSNTMDADEHVDHSGVNVYRTNQIRETQSGLYLLGNLNVTLLPGKNQTTMSGSCINTSEIPEAGITAYASFMHAHQRGRRIWTNIIRNGTIVGTLGNNQNYDFNMQQVVPLTPFVKLFPGDQYVTYCSFDTSKDNTTVRWGETTADEMCIHFLSYFPIISKSIHACGMWGNTPGAVTPGVQSCVLLPNDPPAAYMVSGWSQSDTNFLTGGNATCAPGFTGLAELHCEGYGAPFSFTGCRRGNGTAADDGQRAYSVGVLPTISVLAVASMIAAL